jgi:hypothetical protein
MFFFESQHLPNLPVAKRRLPIPHLPRDLHTRTLLLQKFLGRTNTIEGNCVVCCIKDLESEAAFANGEVTDLTKVTSINIGPSIALSARGISEVGWEIEGVFVRLDDVTDAKSVDI